MDLIRAEMELRIQHRHGDGSWGTFVPEPHSPAEIDPERSWPNGRIYACTSCAEKVVVAPVGEEPRVD